MIVDSHIHLVGSGWVRGKFMRHTGEMHLARYNRIHKTNYDMKTFIDLRRTYIDPNGDKLVETMDAAGVDKAVIFGVDWAYFTGEPPVTIREQNKIHADVAKRHPGRFIPLCALDPRRGNWEELATEAIEEWGMQGFKLMPAIGFYPTDPVCFPLYEKCAKWNVPIMFHSGPELYWEFAHPMYAASAASRYPEVKMILAHASGQWWPTAIEAAARLPNVYVDLSTRQIKYAINPDRFYNWMREIIDECGAEKILWATDWPLPDLMVGMKDWVKAFTERKTNVKFTDQEIKLIMGESARKAWNIKD